MLAAATAICVRDWKLWSSYRMRFVSTIFTALVGVTLFYYVSRLVQAPSVGSPDQYYGFVVVGMVILGVLTSTLTAPIGTLRAELMTGTFERIVVSPFGALLGVLSLALFPLLLGLATGTVTLLFAVVVFGLDLHWATAWAAIPVALLGALAFAPFGIFMNAAVMLYKQTNAGAAFVVTGLSLVAGLYFPVALLPGWIEWTSNVQPMTPAADLLRHLLLGTDMHGSAALALLKLAGFLAVMLPLATLMLRWSIDRSRRQGTITEY